MSDKVVVDKNYQPVKEGAAESAFILNADDPRLKDYQQKAKDANARHAPKAAAAEENDVERVARPTQGQSRKDEGATRR